MIPYAFDPYGARCSREGGTGMLRFFLDFSESCRQRRKARRAFRAYARNGWQCPWIRKNRLWYSVWHR